MTPESTPSQGCNIVYDKELATWWCIVHHKVATPVCKTRLDLLERTDTLAREERAARRVVDSFLDKLICDGEAFTNAQDTADLAYALLHRHLDGEGTK